MMFDLDSPINKGQILQVMVHLRGLSSTIDYDIGHLDGAEFTRLGDGNLRLDRDDTIELLQAIQQTTNLQEIKQALEGFLVSKLAS